MGPDSIQELRAAGVGLLVILFAPRWNLESISRSYPSPAPILPHLSHITPAPFCPLFTTSHSTTLYP